MKKYIFIVFLIAFNKLLISQENVNQHFYNIVPPSPTAQSFHKFGNTDVSLYTGTPASAEMLSVRITKQKNSYIC